MLRFEASSEVQQFREAFRSWLKTSPPPQTKQGDSQSQDAALDTFVGVGREWQRCLASGSWLGVHWPAAFGGRGLPLIYEAVVQEELVRANSPQLLGLFGISMVGPILIDYGTEAQQKRFLSRILSGEDIWCQGFSETEAGSDLSALRTSAKRNAPKDEGSGDILGDGGILGDGFIVNGHKVWTSFAHVADWCFLLCKSFDGTSRYDGFTYLLVDMRSPGISVRPLRQMSGEAEFNEVLFEDVFVPAENILGKEGDGWKIAISTLMYERVILTFARQLQSETLLRREILSRDLDQLTDSQLDQFASHVASLSACRALAYEHLLSYGKVQGAEEGKTAVKPGPEGSLDKLSWTESFQDLCKFILELDSARGIFSEDDNPNMLRYLYSRGRSIAAGTSEIQRNIIAERLLGLPKGRLR